MTVITQNAADTFSEIEHVSSALAYWENRVTETRAISDPNELMDGIALLTICRDINDRLDELKKRAAAMVQTLTYQSIPPAMEKLNQPMVSLGDFKFKISQQFSAKITKPSEGYRWLREIGEGGVIKETVHHATLSSVVRQWIEDNLVDPPDAIEVKRCNYVKISKL